jgi:hypothetical protein
MKKMVMAALLIVALHRHAAAQELFVYTEPASNMAKGAVGMRLTNSFMRQQASSGYQYSLLPEVMVGLSKNWMLHAEGIFSNRSGSFAADGASLYTKYRFLSRDEVQRHFRMAAFGRLSINNSPLLQQEVDLSMYNSGYEGGITATQLLHKLALSTSVSYRQATNNGNGHVLASSAVGRTINYTASAGQLVLPRHYTHFGQTNLNLMAELLGQYNTGLSRSYLDVAPSIQLIFNSRWRVDAGYRQQLYGGLQRMAKNSFLLRLEFNFFNVF